VHLLPAFDEYLVGYRDRRAVLAANQSVNNGWGLLSPTVLVNGSVAGTWGRELRGAAVTVALAPFEPLKAVDSKALPGVVNDYGEFLGKTASIRVRTRPRTVRR
jgi:hypothetical protein